ncbi:MAG TPA: hypothetical protein VG603_03590 [Chitinophagales bacterium]|nr:hypothetical protein [Chitinophagales bacterium]
MDKVIPIDVVFFGRLALLADILSVSTLVNTAAGYIFAYVGNKNLIME